MRNAAVIFKKQLRDTLRNKTILIQFVMFPVLVIIMENTIKVPDMPEHFFAKLFAVMFIGMAPLTCMSSLISEEKEKDTLRVLLMCNVSPAEYLVGVGAYVFMMCTVGTVVFATVGGYSGEDLVRFVYIMSAGIVLSELTGAVIGIYSRDQMAATSLTMPVMALGAFIPMLSTFNGKIKDLAQVVWTQQVSELINGIGSSDIPSKSIVVIAVSFVCALLLFAAAYSRKGLKA